MKNFSSKKTTPKQKYKGFVVYEGPSMLDNAPIVVVATMKTSNRKTGDMVQTWILRSDVNPIEASKQKLDSSICGNCPQRWSNGGACYVNIGQAPNAVYKSYKRGLYPKFNAGEHATHFAGRKVRLGAYGDPAAVPFNVLAGLVSYGIGHTGYTHQAQHKSFDKRYFGLVMVSADTPKMALKMQSLGAKTFRVALEDDGMFENENECFSESVGMTCEECMVCDGTKTNIAIKVHGSRKNKFTSNLIPVKLAA
tara:strand:+ start:138 stop:893 length:756 start_codon:yes stop_codon:yes gene_type:complete